MEYELLGWPPDGPKLRLDHERFSYAGKFVMTNTGKAVARDESGTIVGALAFNEDRTDEDTLWLRYVTVADDRRGDGIGPALVRHVREHAIERGYDRFRIAVNNPFAYEALYRAGFGYTGETTGIAELILEHPDPLDDSTDDGSSRRDRYQDGLDEFRNRDLSEEEETFLEERNDCGPPERDHTTDEQPHTE
ncbi:GNAT family N-acetyltransferase [Natronococcus pandeyae]|uniref:GNAT family N-acetyltransferase n=1 Tax=Natronococcus pandeyae TaxID=2055836 RepID=A0A8J8TSH2_9EURY|nr:GNAT family N-acetyltransferase [Natronococcus pandeyae]TYL40613.1 GNAT family N-acetyltransferase [Natronococcus pandeyae]